MRIDPTLRALADPTRLRIMRLLAAMELAVGELALVLGQSQPRVSRHVRILCDAGLAERRKEGSWVFLRSAIGPGRAPPLGAAAAQLLAVAEESAASYFARHAAEWDHLRGLHSPDAPVEAALERALGDQSLGTLLDVGTGTGRIAELLAPRAAQVTALDNSPEMLRLARARLQHLDAAALELVQGDFTALPFAEAQFDTVVFHQVLHYAQEPERALAEAARVTKPGGTIAVVDFAAHDREELRSQHAHARLGFSDEQMLALLGEAGFNPAPPTALPGTPLTVKIWTGARSIAFTPVRASKASA